MRIWLRPLPFALLFAYVAARVTHAPVDDAAASTPSALCTTLGPQNHIACNAEDVTWIDPPTSAVGAAIGRASRAIVRGRAAGEVGELTDAPADATSLDLFLVTVRLSPEGRLLDVGGVTNLTHTSIADESRPVVRGSQVAYVVEVDGRPEAVHVLDLAGHDPRSYDDLTPVQRVQVSLAEWQSTGSWNGIKRTVFALNPTRKTATLSFSDKGFLEITTDGGTMTIDPSAGTVLDGSAFIRVTKEESFAKPPTFAPWMSDRLRASSWFGDENNQILKVVAFAAIQWWNGTKAKIGGDKSANEVANDLGGVRGTVEPSNFTDPETGWPPKALEPMVKPPLAGEGQWIALDGDPFITPMPGLASPFLTTFVRSDALATHTRVYVTMWDPRLIALHMVAGTVEPVSATGEAGSGVIPRTPEVMKHVVAAFNGGFQATHGEFGMQADGVLYLPPKPYAATILELRDGTTGFGAWPNDPHVPADVLSFRQNMTALVQHDTYNPWNRTWWGGVPPGWADATHTTRSGVCITKENFVAYFYGSDIGPEPLGKAMLIAHCAFGVHLDMNPGLAGFEFYDVEPSSAWKPLGRPLQPEWEFEGGIKDLPDLKFRSRRMVKSMGHMLFPRYIHRDARDFFYLTARAALPGAPLPGLPEGEGKWRVRGLPQYGYPYAIALGATVLDGGKSVRVLRVDPRTVKAEEAATSNVVALFAKPRVGNAKMAISLVESDRKLWLGPTHVFTIDRAAEPGSVLLTELGAAGAAHSAVGISDEDGMLQWLELDEKDNPDMGSSEAMLTLLEKLGCSSRALVLGGTRAFPGASLDLAGQPTAPPAGGVRLVRTMAPGARTTFDDVPIVNASVWSPLQQQRVKWRPTLAPPDKPAGSGSASGSAAPSPAPSASK